MCDDNGVANKGRPPQTHAAAATAITTAAAAMRVYVCTSRCKRFDLCTCVCVYVCIHAQSVYPYSSYREGATMIAFYQCSCKRLIRETATMICILSNVAGGVVSRPNHFIEHDADFSIVLRGNLDTLLTLPYNRANMRFFSMYLKDVSSCLSKSE